ncbi:hypothetical protein [Roseobacter sp. TSBP12]|uniref:hypothetical protein n=1 Tax=Roseobacter sp. TSBP12 TaxID=1236613 RepID=UPI00125FB7F4|nr:hypothetical protein [Roseobacter sp. TSBP12]KAB6717015.1 hypothetical protein C8029_06460 [Roseobacter sp. TSBP12]
MIYRAILFLALTSAPAMADQIELSNSIQPAETDRYGCAIRPRPEHLTFRSFRDSWRSVAADDLYSLKRHQMALEAGSCDCETLWPDWAIIEDEYAELGFAAPIATDSLHIAWSAEEYFPVISDLRDRLRTQCQEAE